MIRKVKALCSSHGSRSDLITLPRQQGLTLLELMIAMALGLFIILGVVLVYVSGVRSSAVNESVARLQEAGRFATQFLSRDIRMAGFDANCPSVNNLLDETHPNYSADLFSLDSAVSGWNNEAGDHATLLTGYVSGTDVISLQSAATISGATAKGNTPANANVITLDTASGLPQGTILLVADLQGCDLFQSRGSETAKSLSRGHSNQDPGPGNKNPGSHDFSHAYDENMQILGFNSVVYYIGQQNGRRPGLYRILLGQGTGTGSLSTPQELVSNVVNMQIEYGEDSNGDNEPDAFNEADDVSDWNDVKSVRVWLLTESESANVIEVAQGALPAPFASVDTSDRRLRYVFSTTNVIRNRMP